MKLTRELVTQFEQEQEEYGTYVALYNLLWLNATDQLKDLGVKHVSTRDTSNVGILTTSDGKRNGYVVGDG